MVQSIKWYILPVPNTFWKRVKIDSSSFELYFENASDSLANYIKC